MADDRSVRQGPETLLQIMHRYRLDILAQCILACQIVARDCMYHDALGKKELTPEHLDELRKVVDLLGFIIKSADGDKSLLAQIDQFVKLLSDGKEKRANVIESTLRQLILGVEVVLKNRVFMHIPTDQARFFMNPEQFGAAVGMFPEALSDMLETGACYAANRPTACVFHAMRVAEHGLRHIARELQVELVDGKKPCPVDFATWEKVLIAISNKREEIRRQPKGEQQNARTTEYAALADLCSGFKDIWRNNTMHSRKIYSTEEAKAAMFRVAEFMNLIAGSEYAPEVNAEYAKSMEALTELFRTEGGIDD